MQMEREKGRYLTLMTKAPISTENTKKSNAIGQKGDHNIDYTTIADRLRTVNMGNDSHPTGVVKPVTEIATFPLTATVVLSKGHTLKFFRTI